uniref:Uncharacterized protein n=1 Tax=Salmonella enterica subsp. indica TaxID=59207 RepID=I3W3Y5_SALER|nr:hypothetical protein [Salmonella enterica subsp. indica]
MHGISFAGFIQKRRNRGKLVFPPIAGVGQRRPAEASGRYCILLFSI